MRIRRILVIIALFVAVLLPIVTVSAVEPFRVAGSTNADRLRVRREPTLTAEFLGNLPIHTDLEILDVTPDEMVIGDMSARWYRIAPLRGGAGIEGWSYGFFIDVRAEDLLALAIWLDLPELVDELLAAGANANASLNEEGAVFTQYEEYTYTSAPVVEAARAGSVEMVRALLDAGSDPNVGYTHGEPGGTAHGNPLILAVEQGNHELVETLAHGGADLEAVEHTFGGGGDRIEMTALTRAITLGNMALAELLLTLGAQVDHTVKYSSILNSVDTWKPPLDIAVENDLTDMAALIRSYGGKPAR